MNTQQGRSSAEMAPTKAWRIAIVAIVLIFLLVDLSLAFWRIRQVYFVSVPIVQLIAIAWGVLIGTITVAATLIRVGGAVLRGLRGVTAEPRAFSIDETIRTVIRICGIALSSLPRSLFVLGLLLVIGYFLRESLP